MLAMQIILLQSLNINRTFIWKAFGLPSAYIRDCWSTTYPPDQTACLRHSWQRETGWRHRAHWWYCQRFWWSAVSCRRRRKNICVRIMGKRRWSFCSAAHLTPEKATILSAIPSLKAALIVHGLPEEVPRQVDGEYRPLTEKTNS